MQTRGVRHKMSGEKEESKSTEKEESNTKDGGSFDEDAKISPEELRKKFMEFVEKNQKGHMSGTMKARTLKEFLAQQEELYKKFNEEFAGKYGFKMERVEPGGSPFLMLWVGAFSLVAISLLFYLIRPKAAVLPEHVPILEQPSITFDQFVQDYIKVGEVAFIFYYPWRDRLAVWFGAEPPTELVGILHPGAVIQGQRFLGSGVHVEVDAKYSSPRLLVQKIREVENEMGIPPSEGINIAISEVSTSRVLFFVLGTLGILAFCAAQIGRLYMRSLFRIVPKKAGHAKRKSKSEGSGKESADNDPPPGYLD